MKIFIAERFPGPAGLHAVTLPRDALTRGASGCSVWIVGETARDFRLGTLEEGSDGPALTLVFAPFGNAAPRHFHLFVTEAMPAATILPPGLAAQLGHSRPPIVLDTPSLDLPPLPPHALLRAQDVAATFESSRLDVVCDYANAWRDMYGAYLSGWTHCGTAPVTRVALVLGERQLTMDLEPRPEVLAHYPECGSTVPVGWRGYIEGPAGVPLRLSVSTATTTRVFTPILPDRLTRPPQADPLVPALQWRFVEMVNAGRLSVLEIGARIVGPEAVSWRGRMAQASRYVGLDIHAADNVDLVGDAHRLTDHVPPGSFDAIWSAETFEHLRQPWLAAAEINRALRIGGLTFHIAPHTWPLHEAPADYWRYSDEGLKSLFGPAFGFEVIDAALVEPAAIHPGRRNFPQCEMPLFPGYGHALVLSRKVAELPPRSGLEAAVLASLGDSRNYPDTDRAARERAARAEGAGP